jgi:hypothetical protein
MITLERPAFVYLQLPNTTRIVLESLCNQEHLFREIRIVAHSVSINLEMYCNVKVQV